MPRFQITDDSNNEKTDYLTPFQADNRYYNILEEEKLQKTLDAGNNKILNVNEDSDIITKTVAEKSFATPIREIIADNKIIIAGIRESIAEIKSTYLTTADFRLTESATNASISRLTEEINHRMSGINDRLADDIIDINTQLSNLSTSKVNSADLSQTYLTKAAYTLS